MATCTASLSPWTLLRWGDRLIRRGHTHACQSSVSMAAVVISTYKKSSAKGVAPDSTFVEHSLQEFAGLKQTILASTLCAG